MFRALRSCGTVLAVSGLALAAIVSGCSREKPEPQPPAVEAEPEPDPTPAEEPPRDPELPGAVSVMVENSPDSRPQSGIEKADLVYEMEAEGGITRFLTFYYQNEVEKIGPVRSARMGFYDVAVAYGVPYAHVGGSNEALLTLANPHKRLLNIDEIYTCGSCFWRTNTRSAPHNVYTSTELLVNRANEVKFALNPLYTFPEGEAPSGGEPAERISLNWSPVTDDDALWEWNGSRYQRIQSGKPHMTESGEQIAADNVVVLFTKYVWRSDAQPNSGLYEVSIIGEGEGYLFRDGMVYPIRWSKPSRGEHYRFTTPEGVNIPLAPGQTWVEILKGRQYLLEGIPDKGENGEA